jgi:hypothetical protein
MGQLTPDREEKFTQALINVDKRIDVVLTKLIAGEGVDMSNLVHFISLRDSLRKDLGIVV